MKLLLKILVFFICAALIAAALFLYFNKTKLENRIKTGIETRLSGRINKNVFIKSLRIIPPGKIEIRGLSVFKENKHGNTLLFLKNITVNPEPLSLFKRGRLEVGLSYSGLDCGHFVRQSSGTIHLSSPNLMSAGNIPQGGWLETVTVHSTGIYPALPGLPEKISGGTIIARISFQENSLKKITARFSDKDFPSRLIVKKIPFSNNRYKIGLSHKDLALEGNLILSGKTLSLSEAEVRFSEIPILSNARIENVHDFKGSEKTLDIFIDEPLDKLVRPPGISYVLENLPVSMVHLKDMFSGIRNFVASNRLSGNLKSLISISFRGYSAKDFLLTSEITIEDLMLLNMPLGDLKATGRLDKHGLLVHNVSLNPFSGSLKAGLSINTGKPSLPYRLELKIDGVDLRALSETCNMTEADVDGTLHLALVLEGDASPPLAGEGTLWLTAESPDLLSLPFLAPLKNEFARMPEINALYSEALRFTKLSGEFEVKGRNISAKILAIESNILYMSGTGVISSEGNLYLDFDNYTALSGTVPAHSDEIFFPAHLSLRGTLKRPRWEIK